VRVPNRLSPFKMGLKCGQCQSTPPAAVWERHFGDLFRQTVIAGTHLDSRSTLDGSLGQYLRSGGALRFEAFSDAGAVTPARPTIRAPNRHGSMRKRISFPIGGLAYVDEQCPPVALSTGKRISCIGLPPRLVSQTGQMYLPLAAASGPTAFF